MTRPQLSWSDDTGALGGAETVPFVILIFVVGSLMVFNLWSVIHTKMALNAAAREAAHAIAEAAPSGSGVDTQVTAEAEAAARNAYQVFTGDQADPNFTVTTDVPGGWRRCAAFTVTVSTRAPLVRLPMVGAVAPSAPVQASSSSIVDPFRDSATVTGEC